MIVLTGRSGSPDWLTFTADSRQVACSRVTSDDVFEGIEFWDVSTGERVAVVPKNAGIRAFVLHPGGRWAYVERDSGDLGLVDLTTGKTIRLVGAPFGRFFPVAVSPDGKRVVASVNENSHVASEWLVCWEHTSAGKRKVGWQRQRR